MKMIRRKGFSTTARAPRRAGSSRWGEPIVSAAGERGARLLRDEMRRRDPRHRRLSRVACTSEDFPGQASMQIFAARSMAGDISNWGGNACVRGILGINSGTVRRRALTDDHGIPFGWAKTKGRRGAIEGGVGCCPRRKSREERINGACNQGRPITEPTPNPPRRESTGRGQAPDPSRTGQGWIGSWEARGCRTQG